jgi:TetR/AcrR family transcriptional regulator, lmrAB and yxaGH operons repressor
MARLLQEQGYTATGLAQVLEQSGVSNGSLYHHFQGGMEELAEAALEASGHSVAEMLQRTLSAAPNTGEGLVAFLDVAAGEPAPGCPIAPTALESPIISPRLRAAAAGCFDTWEELIAARLRLDGWPDDLVAETASTALALIEGALLLARVSGLRSHLVSAQRATLLLLATPPGSGGQVDQLRVSPSRSTVPSS